MSHELSIRSNGFVEHAYRAKNGAGWTGMGQPVPEGASMEEWATAGGFDWRIQRAKVRFPTGRDQSADRWGTMDDQHVLMRSDTKAPLAIVSAKFKVVQPLELLNTFHKDIIAAGFELETCGVLFGGRKFWAMVTNGRKAEIVPGDVVKSYTLLVTATDGTMNTVGKECEERVVCNNTCEMALGETGGKALKISHRSRYDADAMRAALGLLDNPEGQQSFVDKARRMADRQVSRDRAEIILFNLLADAKAKELPQLEAVTRVSETAAFQKIMGLFNGAGKGANLDGVKGTGWGLFNAITEYADWHARSTSPDNRIQSAWFGAGNDLKNRAASLILPATVTA